MPIDRSYSPLPPWRRTDFCGALRTRDTGRQVALWGWVQSRRDHGGLIFIDLRDHEGIVQLVFNPTRDVSAHRVADQVRSEFYLAVRGEVVRRSEGTINAEIPTGEIEIAVSEALILSNSRPLPLSLGPDEKAAEEVRLRYRYIDLRRPEMQLNLRRRYRALRGARAYLDQQGFIEIETPVLWRATPEGARDYLVPSRLNPGRFYALPQSPQILKQLLMIGGFDRYYQVARCFRDEDLRANRQPEFSQIDIEMTCPFPEDVMAATEGVLAAVYREAAGVELKLPFAKLGYHEALERFGTDRPDLRFGLELVNLTDAFAGTSFRVFSDILSRGEAIYAIRVPAEIKLSRRELDQMTEAVSSRYGLGLAWVKVAEERWQGPVAKHFTAAERNRTTARADIQAGDTVLMIGGNTQTVRAVLGELRLELGRKFGLDGSEELSFVWVVDFPLLEYSESEHRMISVNHPFTAPHPDDLALLDSDPLKVRALAYDVVLNGEEIGGGSIRIHSPSLQLKMFELLGMSRAEATKKFGFLIEALGYGAPPHGGIALGVERIAMLLCGSDSLRDVMAFPKTQKAADPMSGAPSEVSPRQLRELSIKVVS